MKIAFGVSLLLVCTCSVSGWKIFPLSDQVPVKPIEYNRRTPTPTNAAPTKAPTVYDLVSGSYDKTKLNSAGHIQQPARDLLPPKEGVITMTTTKTHVNITPKPFRLHPTIVKRDNFKSVTVVPGLAPTPVLPPDCYTTVPVAPGYPPPAQNLNCDNTSPSALETQTLDLTSQDFNITEEAISPTIIIETDPLFGNDDRPVGMETHGGKRDNEKKPQMLSPVVPLIAEKDKEVEEDDDEFYEKLFNINRDAGEEKNTSDDPVDNEKTDEDFASEAMDQSPGLALSSDPSDTTIGSNNYTSDITEDDLSNINTFISMLFNNKTLNPAMPFPVKPTFGVAVEPEVDDNSPVVSGGTTESPQIVPSVNTEASKESDLNDAKDIDSFISILFDNVKPPTENGPTVIETPAGPNNNDGTDSSDQNEDETPIVGDTGNEVPSVNTEASKESDLNNAKDIDSFISILFDNVKPPTVNGPTVIETPTGPNKNGTDSSDQNEDETPIIGDTGNEDSNTDDETSTSEFPTMTITTSEKPVKTEQPNIAQPVQSEEDKLINAKDIDTLISVLFDEEKFPRENKTSTVSTNTTTIDSGNKISNQTSSINPSENNIPSEMNPWNPDDGEDQTLGDTQYDDITQGVSDSGPNNTPLNENANESDIQNPTKNTNTNHMGSPGLMISQPNLINLGNSINPQLSNNNIPPPGFKTTHFVNIQQNITSHSTPNNTNTDISTNYSSKTITESDDKKPSDSPSGGLVNQVSYGGSDLDIPGIDQLPLEETKVPSYPALTTPDFKERKRVGVTEKTEFPPHAQVVTYGSFSINVPAIDILPLQDTKTNPYEKKTTSYHIRPVVGVSPIGTHSSSQTTSSDIRDVQGLLLDLVPPKGSKDIVTLEVIPAHVINVKTSSPNGTVQNLSVVLLPPKLSYFTKY